ncbi:MAG: sodium/solute symporter [Acidobacteriota bacterium]|nr:sodium/solute symporter [Acidobacteriota bacterium]
MLNQLDLLALIAYLGIVLAIGAWCSRGNKGFGDFIFGGGRMPWWAVGISLIATSVSATTFLGNPADVYNTNMTYLMCNFGVFAAILIVWFVFIPRFQGLKVESAYQILEQRFDRKVRLLASVLYSLHLLLRTGILLFGPSLVLAEIFQVHIGWCIGATAVLAVVYTWFGGLRAVVWTDVLQFVVLFGGGLAALYFCARGIGGFDIMAHMAADAGKTRWFDGSLDPSNARTFLSAGLVYTFFEVAIRGCDQQFVQRYMACEDTRRANLSSLSSAVLGLAVGLLFYWVGAALYAYFQVAEVATLPPDTDINSVFPYFILEILPPGLTGILVAAIFAAAMSSLDSAITALANTSVKDFLPQSVTESMDDRTLLVTTRKFVLVWGFLGTAAAFICVAGQKSLLDMALSFTSLFTGPLLGLFVLAFFLPGIKPGAAFWGAIGGMATLLLFTKTAFLPALQPIYPLSWPWNPFVSLCGTVLIALVIQFFADRKAS